MEPLSRVSWFVGVIVAFAAYALLKKRTAAGNDSNLLIVFYVQIMPDDFVMQLHRFKRQRLPSQPCQVLPQIQVMPLNSLRISLADYVQLSLQRDSYSGQPSVIHITTSKGDSRLIRRPSVAIVRSPNTCTTVFRSLSYA